MQILTLLEELLKHKSGVIFFFFTKGHFEVDIRNWLCVISNLCMDWVLFLYVWPRGRIAANPEATLLKLMRNNILDKIDFLSIYLIQEVWF